MAPSHLLSFKQNTKQKQERGTNVASTMTMSLTEDDASGSMELMPAVGLDTARFATNTISNGRGPMGYPPPPSPSLNMSFSASSSSFNHAEIRRSHHRVQADLMSRRGGPVGLGLVQTIVDDAITTTPISNAKLHKPRLATETNGMRTSRKIAEISRASLDFSRISLVGREKEKRVLDRVFQQILKSAKHVGASAKRPPAKPLDEDGSLSTGVDSFQNDDGDSNRSDMVTKASTYENKRKEAALPDLTADLESTVRSFVSISGYSGTGKSALAATLRPKCKANHIFFVTGKFDLKQMDEPYSGFRTAMADLCSQICSLPRTSGAGTHKTAVEQPTTASKGHKTHKTRKVKDTRSFDDIRNRITEELNVDELQALVKIIPNLVDVVGSDALCYPDNAASNTGEGSAAFDKNGLPSGSQHAPMARGFKQQSIALKFAFRHFIKIICHCCPLVWVSDDVQWADKESLDMIESWMLDTTISSLMVVVCFRSNLVDSDGVGDNGRMHSVDTASVSSRINYVGQMLSSIQTKRRERFIRYVDLEVNNISLDDVHVMLKQLLGIYNDDDIGNGGEGYADAHSSGNNSSYGLAEIVFKKTDGNVFFVQQFLRMLVNNNLLTYSTGLMKWVWDNEQIKIETPATINVVELMELKLQQIETAKYMLPLAACLGSTFSWMLLQTTLEGFVEDGKRMSDGGHHALYESLFGGPPPSSKDEWLSILKTYEDEGLIEAHTDSYDGSSSSSSSSTRRSNTGSIFDDDNDEADGYMGKGTIMNVSMPQASSAVSDYSFIHDKVQEAALTIIPSKIQLTELQHRMGVILMDRLACEDFETSLFVVANLLNGRLDMVPPYPQPAHTVQPGQPAQHNKNRSEISQTRRFRVARLNFDAGTRAASHGAFRAAFTYFQNAIDMMPADHWQSHREMSIQLFTSAAECAYVSNKFNKMQEYGNQVVELDDCPLIDKMRAYHVLMDGMTAMVQNDKSINLMKLGSDILAKVGYRYPKNQALCLFRVVTGMMSLKRSARKWTIEYLESLEAATDPMESLIAKTMDKFAMAAFLSDSLIQPLITIDMVSIVMTKGTTNFSPLAISSMSLVLGPILGDMEAGKMYATYAMQKCDSVTDLSAVARTAIVVYGMVLNNVISYEACKQPMLDNYSTSMIGGDIQSAMWSIVFYLDLCWFTARPLDSLDKDFSTYTKVCADFSQEQLEVQLACRWQMVLNLRGRSDHRTLLVGDAFDEVERMRGLEEAGDASVRAMILHVKKYAALYFGEFDSFVSIILEVSKTAKVRASGYISQAPTFFQIAFATTIVLKRSQSFSPSERKRIKQMGKQCRKLLETAVKKGNPNAVHSLAILNAERAALNAHAITKQHKRHRAFRAAVKMYQAAIRIAARGGLIQDQALANERLGEHMLIETNFPNARETAKYHFGEAIRLYGEWRADGKVDQLQHRYKAI